MMPGIKAPRRKNSRYMSGDISLKVCRIYITENFLLHGKT